ncbi:hypothetical protein [Mycobacterium kyogaense]|uniref:hypothetical protein n=1 Tax=Mycobacterium kyogaense TaxID=2212479 RepID=UPI000DAE7969|nr:hypothetical protein [Mycobacterium kyogaense]
MADETHRTLLAQAVDGQFQITGAGLAVLLGISLTELAARCGDLERGYDALPVDLQQLGQRRSREGQARGGASHAVYVLAFWAITDLGDRLIELDLDEAAGSLWAVTTEPIR